jgi:hypothetical protein
MAKRLQVVLGDEDAALLDSISAGMAVTEADAVRAAIRCAGEFLVEPGDEELLKPLASADWPLPDFWGPLAKELERLQAEGLPLETDSGVKNAIVKVDPKAGYVVLLSERSRSGGARTITARMLKNPSATAHGVIIRRLLEVAEEVSASRVCDDGWVGPFKVLDLLRGCLSDDQPWPPDRLGVYVVTRKRWRGAPTPADEVLYLGSTTGRSARFCTRVGDLVADLFGFYGGSTGHSSGGQKLHEWCATHGVWPGDLYIGWFTENEMCPRCAENRIFADLSPKLNAIRPPRCGSCAS